MRCTKLQDLTPGWVRFCLNIQAFMEDLVQEKIKGGKILVAFSGGPDSTGLLRVLHYLQPRTGISIFAGHFNHMLRTGADAEESFAKEVCARLGIPIACGRENVTAFARAGNMGIEEAARTLRYNYIQAVAAEQKADYILTGHHLNDLAEDVLMRMLRGAGWPGLSGMTGFDPARKLVRPFLLTPRETILDFLSAIDQAFMLDSSNEDKSFLRNRIRQELVPVLEDISPGFLRSVAHLWKLGKIDEDYWEKILMTIPRTSRESGQYLSFETLGDLPRAARLRLYKKILDGLGPGQALFDNLLELDRLWDQAKGGKTVQFPGDKFGRIVDKGILFGIKGRKT